MKYIIASVLIISSYVYPNYSSSYRGDISITRNNNSYIIQKDENILDKDIITTKTNGVIEIKIGNTYYYLGQDSKARIGKEVHLERGVLYKTKKRFNSIGHFIKYDSNIKVYADPYPFYAGKVGSLYISSKEPLKIEMAKLKGSASPIVRFSKIKNLKKDINVYRSIFGIYVGSQDNSYLFKANIALEDKTELDIILNIKSSFTPPPPRPKQIPGITKSMVNIINNPQKAAEERELLNNNIYLQYTQTNFVDNVYNMPAQGRYSSQFGTFRGYTKNYARYHQGFDIANTNGSPIYAANNGIVRVARELFVRGNCVVIDHGEGVFSSYFHMSKIAAKEESYVKKGDLIGYIGTTGMSTGPHVHWEMRAGNITFDPLSILEKPTSFNRNILKELR